MAGVYTALRMSLIWFKLVVFGEVSVYKLLGVLARLCSTGFCLLLFWVV